MNRTEIALRLVSPTLLVTFVGGNYAMHKKHLPTLCDTTRRTAHTEKIVGKVIVGAAWGTLTAYMMPHLLAPNNQHHMK